LRSPLARASQIRAQQQRQRGWKFYSHRGKGKASAPYEFGSTASIVTTNARAPGGQFVLHSKALPGNLYDGHTLLRFAPPPKSSPAVPSSAPMSTKNTAATRLFGIIKRELRRRSAIEALIGHMKTDGHLGRCYSRALPAMPPTPYSLPSATICASSSPWLKMLLRRILTALPSPFVSELALKMPC
jgi:IS5 family transposase